MKSIVGENREKSYHQDDNFEKHRLRQQDVVLREGILSIFGVGKMTIAQF